MHDLDTGGVEVARGESHDLVQTRADLKELLAGARSIHAAQTALARALNDLKAFKDDAVVRFYLLQLRERAAEAGDLAAEWRDLLQDSPGDVDLIRGYARRLAKDGRSDEALALIGDHFSENSEVAGKTLANAELLDDIKAYPEADALFQVLIEGDGGREARIVFAKRLRKRGLLGKAMAVISPVAASLPKGSKAAQLADDLLDEYTFFRRLEPDVDLIGQDMKVLAMKHALLYFKHRRSGLRPVSDRPAVALLTGNLGAGGAERQLSRLAELIQSQLGTEHAIASRVDVLVKQYSAPPSEVRARPDFFLPLLSAAGVPVHQLNEESPVSAAHQGFDDPDLLRLLAHLPSQVHYGVTRLLPWFKKNQTDVASLWQDGTCLLGALAALLAETPVIQLVFRGLPPNVRRERFRPEYEVLYSALAEVPGVKFVSNSRAAASAYADWLNLPLDRFEILYNCVPPISTEGSAEDIAAWTAFETATADATETIGGVFRAESDKRPLTWVKLAHRYLKMRPKARFVQVGSGRLAEECLALARTLGIADRLLFVGHSKMVGYWYDKMNVKVMVSRFEGLPNVLIEAQILGVPVVSTPAGGAEECFVNGVTGHLLANADSPDLDEACAAIARYVDLHLAGAQTLKEGRLRALNLFSADAIQRTFAHLSQVGDTQAFPHNEDNPRAVKKQTLLSA
jgi:glycosyltransferase involved in cell wall biosynthesis